MAAELVCPACEKPDGLWEEVEVSGWQAVRVGRGETGSLEVTPTGTRDGADREVDWFMGISSRWKRGGCSCGWEGNFRELVQLGIDGQPLPKPIPGQEAMPL